MWNSIHLTTATVLRIPPILFLAAALASSPIAIFLPWGIWTALRADASWYVKESMIILHFLAIITNNVEIRVFIYTLEILPFFSYVNAKTPLHPWLTCTFHRRFLFTIRNDLDFTQPVDPSWFWISLIPTLSMLPGSWGLHVLPLEQDMNFSNFRHVSITILFIYQVYQYPIMWRSVDWIEVVIQINPIYETRRCSW